MAVHCAACGEELLGAVNRCWRCGASMTLPPTDQDRPPIRQAMAPLLPTEMRVGGADPSAPLTDPAAPAAAASLPEIYDAALAGGEDDALPSRSAGAARRVGSPFAPGVGPRPDVAAPALTSGQTPRQPTYPRGAAAAGGALAALVLGLLSLLVSFFSIGALFLAPIGIGVGIWGLYSERRGQAILGLLLCCIALALSGFQAVVLLYELRYGIKPWDVV